MELPLSLFKAEILALFREGRDEIKNLFEYGLSDYIEHHYQKMAFTNTFLFSHDKVPFYDVFFPLEIETRESWHIAYDLYQKINSTNLIESLFSRSEYVAIVGHAGSGKTMLAKHIFLECCNSKFSKRIPIYVELRSLNSFSGNLRAFVYQILTSNRLKPNSKILERALVNGNFTFIFDGYDELSSDILPKVTFEIESFFDEFNKNQFIITSRPGSNVEGLSRVVPYYVIPLDDEKITSFLTKQLTAAKDVELLHKITTTISDKKNFDFKSYLSSPLLLSMFILTYSQYPDIPRSKSRFYSNVLETLITKHDSLTKKGGFKHPRKTTLANEDFDNILKAFAYISFYESKFDFDHSYLNEKLKFIKSKLNLSFNSEEVIYDLSVSLSILMEDGLTYKFPHRTLQDYLTILFIKDLDDHSKEKIYGEKIMSYFEKFKAVDLSFVTLCMELDKHAFFSFFAKPVFDQFLAKLDGLGKVETLIFMMRHLLFGYDLSRSIFNKTLWNTPKIKEHLVYSLYYCIEILHNKEINQIVDLNIDNRFVDYFGIPLLSQIRRNNQIDAVGGTEHLNLDNIGDDVVLRIVNDYNLDVAILNLVEKIRSVAQEINSTILQDRENFNSIWDF